MQQTTMKYFFKTGKSQKRLASEIQARIIGVELGMLSFDFLFDTSLGSLILH